MMGRPYGHCTDYSSQTKPIFNSISYSDCFRKCFRKWYKIIFRCDTIFVDNLIHEREYLNNIGNNMTGCDPLELWNNYHELSRIHNICNKLCPKDCLRVDYSYNVMQSVTHSGTEHWFIQKRSQRWYEITIIWDITKPMVSYVWEPVMTFTDYLITCGGLLGLWFGTNAKDLIVFLIENNIKAIVIQLIRNILFKLNSFKIIITTLIRVNVIKVRLVIVNYIQLHIYRQD